MCRRRIKRCKRLDVAYGRIPQTYACHLKPHRDSSSKGVITSLECALLQEIGWREKRRGTARARASGGCMGTLQNPRVQGMPYGSTRAYSRTLGVSILRLCVEMRSRIITGCLDRIEPRACWAGFSKEHWGKHRRGAVRRGLTAVRIPCSPPPLWRIA